MTQSNLQSAWILSDTLLHGEIITERRHAKCTIKRLSQTRGRMTQRITLHFNRRRCRSVPKAQLNRGSLLLPPKKNVSIGWEGSSQNLAEIILSQKRTESKTHDRIKDEEKTTESQMWNTGTLSLPNSGLFATAGTGAKLEELSSPISGL